MSIFARNDSKTLDRCHAVPCPFCHVVAGQYCVTVNDNLTYPHLKRRRWALVNEARARTQESAS